MAKESIVPGLGKKQIAVLNNEHARQLEHKRHLEELGFPEYVEPDFARHAPVSYDDPSNPTSSRIVNQAGQDLGDPNKEESNHYKEFKYKAPKKIAKEAFLDFIQKQPANVEEAGGGGLKGAGATGGPSSLNSASAPSAAIKPPRSVLDEAARGTFQTAADMKARANDPSMTTDVAGTRDSSDALFDFDPTGTKGSGSSVGGYADGAAILGTGAGAQGGLPSDAKFKLSDEIENADFDTQMNEAQTRQIVKEAVSEVFLNKDTAGGMGLPSLESLKNKKEKEELTPEEERRKYGDIGYGILNISRVMGKIPGALKDAYEWEQQYRGKNNPLYDTTKLVPASWQKNPPKTEKELKEFLEDKANTEAKQQQLANIMTGIGIDIEPYKPAGRYDPTDFGGPQVQPGVTQSLPDPPDADEKPTETITVDPNAPDASGVPQRFQPGGLVGGTYESGSGETMNQKIEKPPQPELDPSKFGQTGAREIKDIRDVGGTLYGTVSGSGTNPYSIEIKPETYAGVKAGDTISYNPSQDPKGFNITNPAGETSAGTRPGPTLAEAQRKIAQANPAAQPKNSPYLKNMQKYQAWIEKAEDEGAMAKVQLDRVSDLADMMHDILDEDDQLPGWIQNKISDSLHNLEASMSHIMYDEKQEQGLRKSVGVFEDFLASAPQERGGDIQKALPAVLAGIASVAPIVAKGLAKLFTKTVPKMKRGKPLGKLGADGKLVQQTTTVLSPLKTAGTVGTAAYLYDTVADPDWSPFEGLKGEEFEAANKQWKEQDSETKQAALDVLGDEVAKGIDQQPQEFQDEALEAYKYTAQDSETYGYLPGEEWKGVDASIRSTEKDPNYKPASSIMPVYDSTPEQTAKVRAGGPEKITGYKDSSDNVTNLKTPVSNMGALNRTLVKEAFIELQKERKKDSRLKSAGVSGYNKPKRTPKHPKKSHVVVAKDGTKVKTIRFGEQGASTAGDRKKGESSKMRKKRKSFKARHAKNIKRGKMSAAYWADKVKW